MRENRGERREERRERREERGERRAVGHGSSGVLREHMGITRIFSDIRIFNF